LTLCGAATFKQKPGVVVARSDAMGIVTLACSAENERRVARLVAFGAARAGFPAESIRVDFIASPDEARIAAAVLAALPSGAPQERCRGRCHAIASFRLPNARLQSAGFRRASEQERAALDRMLHR
jgi:hypothetical protein